MELADWLFWWAIYIWEWAFGEPACLITFRALLRSSTAWRCVLVYLFLLLFVGYGQIVGSRLWRRWLLGGKWRLLSGSRPQSFPDLGVLCFCFSWLDHNFVFISSFLCRWLILNFRLWQHLYLRLWNRSLKFRTFHFLSGLTLVSWSAGFALILLCWCVIDIPQTSCRFMNWDIGDMFWSFLWFGWLRHLARLVHRRHSWPLRSKRYQGTIKWALTWA